MMFLKQKLSRMTESKDHPLTTYRVSQGNMTLDAFAKLVGASKGTVSKWENGTIPRRDQMMKIIEVTNGEVTSAAWYEGASA